MKNRIFSLLAVVIAIAAAAFTTVNKSSLPAGTKLFRYTAPGGSFTEANVENRANWVLVTGASQCNGVNQKACELIVDDIHINPNNTLKSTLTIDAVEYEPGIAFVETSNATQIDNKTK